MRKTIFGAVLALAALSAISGCHKIRKCTVGEEGCLDGEPSSNDPPCKAGLVLNDTGDLCVKPGEGGGGNNDCNCAIDEVCDAKTKTCIGYCDYADDVPEAKAVPKACKPVGTTTPLTFRQLCIATCEQNCLRAQVYCPGYQCDPAECESPATIARCIVDCPGMDTTCMQAACNQQQAQGCQGFRCPGSYTRDCADIRCTDSCASDNVKDGYCDDGDPNSAAYSFCQYGSDCSDCGPRRGARAPRVAIGELCPMRQDVACEGYHDNFLEGSAWCLRILDDADAPYRCVPGCNDPDGGQGACPAGYKCQAAMADTDTAFTDAYEHPGYFCQPTVCK